MRILFKKSITCVLILLCSLFSSCDEYEKHLHIHKQRIDTIEVLTLQKDTVLIIGTGEGHIRILPKDYIKY